jgi:hypothetical protein
LATTASNPRIAINIEAKIASRIPEDLPKTFQGTNCVC